MHVPPGLAGGPGPGSVVNTRGARSAGHGTWPAGGGSRLAPSAAESGGTTSLISLDEQLTINPGGAPVTVVLNVSL